MKAYDLAGFVKELEALHSTLSGGPIWLDATDAGLSVKFSVQRLGHVQAVIDLDHGSGEHRWTYQTDQTELLSLLRQVRAASVGLPSQVHVPNYRSQGNELAFYLDITGFDFDPDVVTDVLQIQPTAVARKQANVRVRAQNAWTLCSNPPIDRDNIPAHWNDLAGRIAGKHPQIRDLSDQAKVTFTLWVPNGLGDRPILVFPREWVETIGQCGGRFQIDYA